MHYIKKGLILLLLVFVLGLSGTSYSADTAAERPAGLSFGQPSNAPTPDATFAATTNTEDFADPLGGWLNRWFFLNSNAENYYTANGNCDPNFRGNQPFGIWISDDQGCGGIISQSPVRINFSNNFGDTATSFSLDQFTCVDGVTFNIYDKNGTLDSSTPLPNLCFTFANYVFPLTNGISAFEYSYTVGPVEGNTAIDNVVLVVADPVVWNICVKDVAFIDEMHFNVEAGDVIRGMTDISFPNADYPAPLTGHFDPITNMYSWSIGYLTSNATRHYRIDGSTGAGHTWGILGTDSSYYHGPINATVDFCGPSPEATGEGISGAPK